MKKRKKIEYAILFLLVGYCLVAITYLARFASMD